eukprot:1969790-Prymnesium_polylepis.1
MPMPHQTTLQLYDERRPLNDHSRSCAPHAFVLVMWDDHLCARGVVRQAPTLAQQPPHRLEALGRAGGASDLVRQQVHLRLAQRAAAQER